MWKKRLILFVTFIAGLYYFLEFVVPPTMPGNSTAGVVRSIETTTDQPSKTSHVKIVLDTFTRISTLPVSPIDKITCVTENGDEQVETSKLRPTDIVMVNDSDKGMVTATNNAQVRVGIFGGARTINAEVNDGKSNILAYRTDETGGDNQVDDLKTLAVNDLVTRIGPTTYLSGWMTDVGNFFVVLTTMPWGFALFSLWLMHSSAIRKHSKEWYNSLLFFLGLVIGILGGMGYGITATTKYQTFLVFMNDTVSQYIGFAFYSATFSILSFYLASAAYRSFKAKSREAVLMMVASLIVMLGQIPFGLYLTKWIPYDWAQMPVISQWLQLILNTAAYRGMWFGMMLASMAIGLRYWLSLERGAFFDREL